MTVLPGDKSSTAHLSLTDGVATVEMQAVGAGRDPNPLTITRNPVERNPLKTTAGSQTYSDFDFPYTVIAQDNWAGGRGKNKFEADTTGYMDSGGLALDRVNKAFLAGREAYSVGLRSAANYLPGAVVYASLIPGIHPTSAVSVTFTGGFTIAKLFLLLRKVGTPGNLTVEIRSADYATIYATGTITAAMVSDSKLAEYVGLTLATGSGTRLVFYCTGTDTAANHWEFGGNNSLTSTRSTDAGMDASHWTSNVTPSPYFRLVDGNILTDAKLIEYKGAQYLFTKTNTLAGQIFINGDRGAADAPGAANYLDDATKSWTVDEWAGCIVQITGGVGVEESQNWRKIISNTATRLVVDSNWGVTHTTATEYAIIASDKWTEITGHGLTKPITDVVVSNKGVIYIAQGNGANIRRARFYNNAGTWTAEYADDGTNKAVFLAMVHSSTGWELWKGDNVDANGDVSVAKSTPPAWGTNLTPAAALIVGMQDELITSLVAYVDANQAETLWILTEGAPWYIQSGVPVRVPLREYRTVKNSKNGRTAAVANVNIFFSMGIGLERYYNGTLDDLGPNLGEGLPANRSGRISALVAYPGRVFAAIDAVAGYSSVLTYNGSGWNEVYRAPKGERITALQFQPIPGATIDRLWVRQGADMLYIPFPSETFDPLQDTAYPYRNEGYVEMSWQSAGLLDAWKYFRQIKLFIEQGAANAQWLEAQYKVDDDTAWTDISGTFTDTVDEALIGSGVNGKRFKMRLIIYSTDLYKSPVLKAAILEAVTVTATKWSFQFTSIFRNGSTELAQLDTWAGTAKPLLMRCIIPLFDNREVFLMALPVTMEAVDVRTEGSTSLDFSYRANIILQEA